MLKSLIPEMLVAKIGTFASILVTRLTCFIGTGKCSTSPFSKRRRSHSMLFADISIVCAPTPGNRELDGFIKAFLNTTVSGCNMNVVHLSSGLTMTILRCFPRLFSKSAVLKQKDVSYILKKFFLGEKVWKRVLVKNFGFISLFFKDFLQKTAWIFILRNLSYAR